MINRPIRTCLITLFASIAASIALCLPVLNVSLVSDDWVLLDAVVHKGVWAAWGGGGHEMLGFFRPLITLTLWINYQIGGLNPLGYHVFNAFAHGVCAWLVGVLIWLQLRNTGSGEARLIPAIGSLLFLTHPSHVEPVAWVSSRGDLMACMFGLGAIAAWLMKEQKLAGNPVGKASGPVSFLSLGLFVLALLAKESVVVLPVILFAFEMIVGAGNIGERFRLGVRRTWPFFAILIIFMIVRALVLGHAVGGYGSERILAVNPLMWARNLSAATERVFLPVVQSRPTALIAICMILAFSIALFLENKNIAYNLDSGLAKSSCFSVAAFLISMIPIANLPLSLRSSEGERFIYLPTAFALMFVAVLLGGAIRQYWRWVFITAILILYSIAFQMSLATWREAGRLAGYLIVDFERIVGSQQIESVHVFNLPDHLRGAYVFRNGFVEAARLNGITPERIKEIKIKNAQPIRNVNDKFAAPTLTASSGTISVNYSEGKLKEISR